MRAFLVVMSFCIFIDFEGISQSLDIQSGWKFRAADSSVFSKPNYNASHWTPIWPGTGWQDFLAFKEVKGSNWYRQQINILSDFKRENMGGIFLNLKRISGADEAFFNGHPIGRTGNVVNGEVVNEKDQRQYFIPNQFIQFDQENTIAIRVTDFGIKSGLTQGKPTISLPATKNQDEGKVVAKLDKLAFDGQNKFIIETNISKQALAKITENKGAWINVGQIKRWESISINGVKAIAKVRNRKEVNFLIPESAFLDQNVRMEVSMKDENVGSFYRIGSTLESISKVEWLEIEAKTVLEKEKLKTRIHIKNQSSWPVSCDLGVFYTKDMFSILKENHKPLEIKANADTSFTVIENEKFSGAIKTTLRIKDLATGFVLDKVSFSEFLNNNKPDAPKVPTSGISYSDQTSDGFKIPFVVKNIINEQYTPFQMQNQQLAGNLGFLFYNNLEKRLLKVDTAEIMSGYKNRPGKQTYIGEHAGKYIQTATNTWLTTGNKELKQNLDNVVRQLISTQLTDGYLGTYLPKDYWTQWDVWSHKYNMIGLLTYYRATGYVPAFEASKKIGNLLCRVFGENPDQKNLNLSGYHQGMAPCSVMEPIIDLYRLTGDEQYFKFCQYIIRDYDLEGGSKLIKTLLKKGNVLETANAKAYEMLSNLVGVLKMYKLTADTNYLKACMIAWNDVRTKRLYITGTASSHEHFQDDYYFPFENADQMGEGCVTTTWIQFSLDLFRTTGNSRFMDEIERSIYNHLPAAENPQSGCVSYYTPLAGKKPHSCALGSSCCLSSVPRGISYIPQLIWGNYKGGIGIFQYTQGSVKDSFIVDSGQKIPFSLNIETTYPLNGKVAIKLGNYAKTRFPISLRVPAWTNSFIAKAGGKSFKGKPGTILTIDLNWNPGDQIDINMDMSVQTIPGHTEFANLVAIQRGPQVLALDSSLNYGLLDYGLGISLSPIKSSELKDYDGKFPDKWIGNQAWTFSIGKKAKPLILTPFNLSGQMATPIKVWLEVKR